MPSGSQTHRAAARAPNENGNTVRSSATLFVNRSLLVVCRVQMVTGLPLTDSRSPSEPKCGRASRGLLTSARMSARRFEPTMTN
jgi:hypothetical protein